MAQVEKIKIEKEALKDSNLFLNKKLENIKKEQTDKQLKDSQTENLRKSKEM